MPTRYSSQTCQIRRKPEERLIRRENKTDSGSRTKSRRKRKAEEPRINCFKFKCSKTEKLKKGSMRQMSACTGRINFNRWLSRRKGRPKMQNRQRLKSSNTFANSVKRMRGLLCSINRNRRICKCK